MAIVNRPTAAWHMATTTIRIGGMTYDTCTSTVESGVKSLPGVSDATVSLVLERCVVTHNSTQVSPDQIQESIIERGFDAEVLSTNISTSFHDDVDNEALGEEDALLDLPGFRLTLTTLSVGGMTCGACTSAVQGALKDVPGISSFSISLLSERAVVEHYVTVLAPEKIAEKIEDAGFDAAILSSIPVEYQAHILSQRAIAGKQAHLKVTTVAVEGMTCGACTSAVQRGFQDLDGVAQFNISLIASRCVIFHDSLALSSEKIVAIVEDCGFSATLVSSEESDVQMSASHPTVQLKVFGLSDAKSCQTLEDNLSSLPGIKKASISKPTHRAAITYSASTIGIRAVVKAVEDLGYNALVAETDDNNAQLESLAKTREIQIWYRDFRISLAFAVPVFCTSMLFPMYIPSLNYGMTPIPIIPGLWLGDVVCLWLTIPVQFWIGRRFYVSAFRSLRHRSPTMDVLVVLGTSAAFFFSVVMMLVSILTPPHSRPATVFDTSTMLITFITLGRWLENRAKGQTSKALSRLMSLTPSMATIYSDPIAAEKYAESQSSDSDILENANEKSAVGILQDTNMVQEEDVATELIQTNDIVILKPGAKVPADGVVIRGKSWVNEGMISGEAKPILKKRDSQMIAGTVNGEGRIDFKVTRAGSETKLSQIVKLVARAQATRAPIQRLADKVAGYFVPVIIALGLSTFFGWMILSHILPHPPEMFLDHGSGGWLMVCLKLCISVIVFACPCALGLSTPTAVMVGTGVGAEQGMLFKGGEILEIASKITHVFFDKTGTLTSGKMSISYFHAIPPPAFTQQAGEKIWWTAIGLAEMSSEHPVGKTIVSAAKDALHIGADGHLEGSVDQFEVAVGHGISARVIASYENSRLTKTVLIGNLAFLVSRGVTVPEVDSLATEGGATTIYVAIDGSFAGYLLLADSLKRTAAATINALSYMGISSSLVTGDAPATAQNIAKLVNIPPSNVHASCSPEQKQALIVEAKVAGQIVAMVGDGINDAVALSAAHVGISFSSATGVAVDSAQIVLMRDDDLLSVPAALNLSRTIFNRIKLNLVWACMYNVIGLPVAMGFFLPWGLSLQPMWAGGAMALSSVTVVVSSLLLKFWKRPRWMNLEYLETEKRPRVWWKQTLIHLRVKLGGMLARRQNRGNIIYVPLSAVDDRV